MEPRRRISKTKSKWSPNPSITTETATKKWTPELSQTSPIDTISKWTPLAQLTCMAPPISKLSKTERMLQNLIFLILTIWKMDWLKEARRERTKACCFKNNPWVSLRMSNDKLICKYLNWSSFHLNWTLPNTPAKNITSSQLPPPYQKLL